MPSTGPRVIPTARDVSFAPFNHVPCYTPTIWQGMELFDWMKLVAEQRAGFDWARTLRFLFSFSTPPFITGLNRLQHLLFGRQAASTLLEQEPLFVIGHWRSGTTLLHELFTLDDRFRSPTTFQVFCPYSFFLTESWFKPATWFAIPSRRPMDNMEFGWDTPQEDEFAIVSMGLPTTYRRMAFPNNEPVDLEALNMEGMSTRDLERWKRKFKLYVQYLNLHYRKPLALKSPPHTGRIRVLLEMFPRAKFVHITRDPQRFIPSTMHLWGALDRHNGMQLSRYEHLRSHVFDCFERLYEGYFRDESLLTRDNLITIRFGDLVRDPIAEMSRIYRQLDLGPIDAVVPQLRQRMDRTRDYQPNQHERDPVLAEEIADRCSIYTERFGYKSDKSESVAA